jgi:hypothetical protein
MEIAFTDVSVILPGILPLELMQEVALPLFRDSSYLG